MSMFTRRQREVPGLNTSSLPDLIFTVLFFFMIVTHMRKATLKVRFQQPQGTELTRLQRKSAVTYIYIGRPQGATQSAPATQIQINDKIVPIEDVADCMAAEKNRMSPEDVQRMTVSLKADRDVPMGIVTDVKQALREAGTLRISYSADEKKPASSLR